MSTDQPAPGPEDARPEPPAGGEPPPGPPTPPPGPEGGSPYGAAPPPPQAEVRDPLAEMPPLADRWRRLVARIIDALIIGIPISVVVALAWGGYDVNDTGRSATQDLVYGFVYFVYEGLMLTTRGQTVGKMAMNIRVGMLQNGQIPAGRAGWTRAAVYALPPIVPCCGSIFWLVNVLWLLWDKPYRQALHDKAARTVVVSLA